MRAQTTTEIARNFPRDRQALAFALLAQDLLINAEQRSSLDYARGWLAVIEAHLQGDIEAAARAMMRVCEIEPKLQ
jgi:hypothetical protein